MSLSSPALQTASEKFTARRAVQSFLGVPGETAVAQKRHPQLLEAYAPAGKNTNGPMLYFMVRYCPDCMRGVTLDLVRDVPAGLPNAHDLGIKRAKQWSLECLA